MSNRRPLGNYPAGLKRWWSSQKIQSVWSLIISPLAWTLNAKWYCTKTDICNSYHEANRREDLTNSKASLMTTVTDNTLHLTRRLKRIAAPSCVSSCNKFTWPHRNRNTALGQVFKSNHGQRQVLGSTWSRAQCFTPSRWSGNTGGTNSLEMWENKT